MYTVVLTGGIGSGKSQVAKYFSQLGIPIIDADIIARTITQTPKVLTKIKNELGSEAISNGRLNRSYIRTHIFKSSKKRQWLEALLHPLIRQQIRNDIATANGPYCIIVIPLLAETGFEKIYHRVLVVDAPETLQIHRAAKRDNETTAAIMAIVKQQASRQKRLALADDIITNNKDLGHLQQQVKKLHQLYLSLAGNRPESDDET